MNIFKELKRVERYKPLNPWLGQKGVVGIRYNKEIKVDVMYLSDFSTKTVYLPTCSNGRRVVINHLSTYEFFTEISYQGYFYEG